MWLLGNLSCGTQQVVPSGQHNVILPNLGFFPTRRSSDLDRDGVEVHKLAKKERGQYPAILTEQAWSIKDLLYGFWEIFLAGLSR